MNNKKNNNLLKLIKGLNVAAAVVDLVFIIAYAIVLVIMFNAITIPGSTNDMQNPQAVLSQYFKIGGMIVSSTTVNYNITLMIIFLIFATSLFVVNLKHLRKIEFYDYHRWESGNIYAKAVLSLTYLNFASFIIRIVSAELLMRYSEGISTFSFLKLYFKEKKERKLKYANNKNKELLPEEVNIKNKVRKQITAKVVRYSLTYLFLILIAVFILIPFYWMLLTSLKTYQQSNDSTNPELYLSFKDMQWLNIKFVIENLNFGVYIKNTLIVAVVSTFGTIVTTIFASFAFARIEFKGREAIFSVLLMTMMIPGEIYMITNFLTVSKSGFNWIGSSSATSLGYFATMILPFMTSVYYIFFLRQTFKQIPDSLYKAAKVDGCSDMKFLRRIMIPIAGPTIFTITILSILGSWNAYIWPKLITGVEPVGGKNFWLISVALRETSFVLENGADVLPMFNLQIAASAIVTLPLLLVFLTLRKYIIRGVGRSGTKG